VGGRCAADDRTAATLREPTTPQGGILRTRLRNWMDSDLIGIPVALLAAGIALLSVLAIYLGPIRGLVFSAPVWATAIYLALRRGREPTDIADLDRGPAGAGHRVLVVANHGLESAALRDELGRRAESGPIEVMFIAPAPASSSLHTMADDFDVETREAGERVDAAVRSLTGRGVRARGHVDPEAEPLSALVDGLREFPADEVLIVPAAERNWEAAERLSERIRREAGVAVTEIAEAGG